MRPLTIDMHRLEFALDGRDTAEYYLDLESGEIRAISPGDPAPGVMDKYDIQQDRYLHIAPLELAQAIAMREGRKPLRTFDFKLEDFPTVREAWLRYQTVQLREYAVSWLRDNDLEPARS